MSGSVACWGSNSFGGLGDGTNIEHHTPILVSGLSSGVSIATGEYHSCAVLADGTAYCWGYNWAGQLGDGTIIHRYLPTTVIGNLTAISHIESTYSHNCVRYQDGTAAC
ncbi:MAG: hypothetical protein IPK16_28590 [Anaerolineales bacterium]|nr:hypothetical protein [Anaerolineales bacterium]